jgi:hypothetical protein
MATSAESPAGATPAPGRAEPSSPALTGNHQFVFSTFKVDTVLILFSLLATGEYSDMEIKCNGEIFKVHRSILCIKSPVLKDMVDGRIVSFRSKYCKLQ